MCRQSASFPNQPNSTAQLTLSQSLNGTSKQMKRHHKSSKQWDHGVLVLKAQIEQRSLLLSTFITSLARRLFRLHIPPCLSLANIDLKW